MIPENELISILTDVYIADGLLTLQKVHIWFNSLDSLSSYITIIENHGYTKEAMDRTMEYYFIKKPKKLIMLYDQVLGVLSELESYLEKEFILETGRVKNFWTGKELYVFPAPSGTDETRFDIPLNRRGVYYFTFTATLYPDDQSVNPQVTAYLSRIESSETDEMEDIETREYIESINYIKDGQPHTYTLIFTVPGITRSHFKGLLFDYENHPDEWEKHARFEDISLVFKRVIL